MPQSHLPYAQLRTLHKRGKIAEVLVEVAGEVVARLPVLSVSLEWDGHALCEWVLRVPGNQDSDDPLQTLAIRTGARTSAHAPSPSPASEVGSEPA
jgi:hypothetical protein